MKVLLSPKLLKICWTLEIKGIEIIINFSDVLKFNKSNLKEFSFCDYDKTTYCLLVLLTMHSVLTYDYS